MSDQPRREIRAEFCRPVNMVPSDLERWLKRRAPNKGGVKLAGGGESVGHGSGRRTVELKRTLVRELTDAHYARMRGPGAIESTGWGYSLMNWGRDPLERS